MSIPPKWTESDGLDKILQYYNKNKDEVDVDIKFLKNKCLHPLGDWMRIPENDNFFVLLWESNFNWRWKFYLTKRLTVVWSMMSMSLYSQRLVIHWDWILSVGSAIIWDELGVILPLLLWRRWKYQMNSSYPTWICQKCKKNNPSLRNRNQRQSRGKNTTFRGEGVNEWCVLTQIWNSR